VLIAVAQRKLQVTDVQIMLNDPSPNSWTSAAAVAPAHGLYLIDVEYDLADIIVNDAGQQAQVHLNMLKYDYYATRMYFVDEFQK
jgi:tRNA U38,U39,U40 pseudouridine synthase TruA